MAAQTCFTDGLHLIFSFLPLSDVSSSSSVCRRWSSAVSSEPPRAVRCDLRSASALRDLATSNLRRHVKTLDITQATGRDSSMLMTDDLPELICRRMTNVTHLLCAVDLQRLDELQFPADLRTLEVKIARPAPIDHDWCGLSMLLTCAARVPLAKLRITTPPWDAVSMPPAAAMEPLRQLRDTITDFEFPRPVSFVDGQWNADHFALFHSLSHLTRLNIAGGRWLDEELQLLAANPPPHLQSLSCDLEISDRRLVAISRLQWLTNLTLSMEEGELIDLSVLCRLTRLATLHLHVNKRADATQVSAALKQCTTITDLTLEDVGELTDVHLCDLLPSLAGLRRLTLRLEDELDDLSCLSAASNLADTLGYIHITGTVVPHHALVHLRSLRRLKSAEVKMRITRRVIGTKDTSDGSDDEAVYLPMLEDLRIGIFGEGNVDLLGMLGRLPQLRVAHLQCENGIDVPPLVQLLAHAHSLTTLNLKHLALTDAHLCTLMPSLPHFCELTLCSHTLVSLRFASSSARLAHTLEKLDITNHHPHSTHSLPMSEFTHLRSLGRLRRLDLRVGLIAPAASDQDREEHSNWNDIGAGTLGALTSLCINTQHMGPNPRDSLELDLSFLGPMPRLRSCQLRLRRNVQVTSIARALKHCTKLVTLIICHAAITDDHLAELMPHLTHLRSLEVASESHFGGLSFASSAVAPRLAATLTRLSIRTTDRTPMKPSDLHHLRALAYLTNLRLCFPQSRASLAADQEEMSINSPHFRRDCWPRMRHAHVQCD